MATVTTVVHIAAPPALVRALFLDFPSLPQYHTGHFAGINILACAAQPSAPQLAAAIAQSSTAAPIGAQLAANDRLQIKLGGSSGGGMSFKATVAENSERRFAWRGGWSSVVVGEHSFQFDDGDAGAAASTRLTHAETFTGGLVTVCKPFLKSNDARTSPGFERFNADLKAWAEAKAREAEAKA